MKDTGKQLHDLMQHIVNTVTDDSDQSSNARRLPLKSLPFDIRSKPERICVMSIRNVYTNTMHLYWMARTKLADVTGPSRRRSAEGREKKDAGAIGLSSVDMDS